MFDRIDRAYFEKRALEEIEKAENCIDPGEKRLRLAAGADFARKARALDSKHVDDVDLVA
ncbi:hypothetical protein [Sphingobium phenoxybenzoativorans]|uniref:hypothetical protein n=1 Tax=Sphingobium phenoxybenzoativorans TaxID=1592790 RepID=UPI000872F78E|nr:hypothetical protein [Sphingobium phenoxybenzoativorans]